MYWNLRGIPLKPCCNLWFVAEQRFFIFAWMKRLVVFLLALMVLAGSMSYCCSTDDCNIDLTGSTSHTDEGKETGSCSPFLTCGSCSGFVQMAKIYTVIAPVPESQSHHEKISPFLYSTYFSSFFQPPKEWLSSGLEKYWLLIKIGRLNEVPIDRLVPLQHVFCNTSPAHL